ncbi:MAG TPA: AAA family ATPase [Candidatus Saccharimonadales bacterium]|nr:AAA family ATPase [Candidatus Saccharimonadales bacterium]
MKPGLDLSSSRAQQARLSLAIARPLIRASLIVAYLFGMGVGLWLVVLGHASGWLLATLAFWPVMPLVWYEWWLKELPPPKRAESVDDWLEPELLGRLKGNMSPQQIAELTMRTNGGLFFMARLGIGPNFLRDMSPQNAAESQVVWQNALQLRHDLQLKQLSAPVVAAALVRSMANRDQLLARLQITFEDVLSAVRWYHHIDDLREMHSRRRNDGGIGRDLSFGYTNMLSRFATNVSQAVGRGGLTRELEAHQNILDQLIQQLTTSGRRNAVLVGPNGVGKTTLVYAFAERLLQDAKQVPPALRYRQVMALDPASLISHARGRGELEALLTQLLNEAYAAKNVILFFDNAELFFGESTGAVDVRNILLPVLESGAITIILSMDEQQWLKLGRTTPSLTQQLSRISVQSLNESDTLLVCEDKILEFEYRSKSIYMYQAMKTAYRLGTRYVADMAMPGQALHILEAAAQHAEGKLVTAASVEKAVEQLYGVKVANARGGDERQMLLNLENLLHERMINQVKAVAAVANALRRARSGVRNQNRPIGSFMFLGPTGVGKTELAKALAAVYFGGEDHLIRLDLNEFGRASDVGRLIADAATDPLSLTAQISKQPFSVVLLDEIEKAHPNVLNTLLQLLDEGIMRDVNNREISFRDAVLIATSNAGADRIRQYIEAGYELEQFQKTFVDELINAGLFKPEFLNRFDEIVVFRPLKENELLQVIDLMLAGVNKTLAQQQLSVHVADDAKKVLVGKGNDPRLGARPMRRIVQRTVENIVAKRLLEGEIAPGTTIEISLSDIQGALEE